MLPRRINKELPDKNNKDNNLVGSAILFRLAFGNFRYNTSNLLQ